MEYSVKTNVLVLKSGEICPFKDVCQEAMLHDSFLMCWGCREGRYWNFTCLLKDEDGNE